MERGCEGGKACNQEWVAFRLLSQIYRRNARVSRLTRRWCFGIVDET